MRITEQEAKELSQDDFKKVSWIIGSLYKEIGYEIFKKQDNLKVTYLIKDELNYKAFTISKELLESWYYDLRKYIDSAVSALEIAKK